jgi:hypothetical protein
MQLSDFASRGDPDGDATARPYRVVDPLDETGRMTLRAADGTDRTVVDCLDDLVAERLSDREPGSVVRLELAPVPDGEGHVAARHPTGSPTLV